ncbi:MAG TPA: PKD domain-containing protein [Methanoregulaceae archaeon]|nr:PKD domain-containing protein [Methanoregulaceae archaeon]
MIVYITIVLVIGILSLAMVVAGDTTGSITSQEIGSGSDPGATTLIAASQTSGGQVPGEAPVQVFSRTIPAGFIRNDGQAGDPVVFQIISDGGSVFFTGQKAVFARSNSDNSQESLSPLSITFVGAGKSVIPEGSGPVSGTVNFITGPEQENWHTGIPSYGEIRYKGLYQGIDLTYKSSQGALKSEFLISPGASPSRIQLQYSGMDSLSVAPDGTLVITTHDGTLLEQAPEAYQVFEGVRIPVEVHYKILPGNSVGFSVGTYMEPLPLVIDPVMKYGIYLSGIGVQDANAVAKDNEGNIYIAGRSYPALSMDSHGAVFQAGGTHVIVVKINEDGSAPLYITYIGGNGSDKGAGIAIDDNGDAYVTGSTDSPDFPLVNPLQGTLKGTSNAFVAKLGPSGDAVIYSTYLGGTSADYGNAIAIDGMGSAYITGTTTSADFPVISQFQRTAISGGQSAFISKLSETGGSLEYSGFLGGNAPTSGNGIAVDTSGSAFVTGQTFASDFPVVNGSQVRAGGNGDAYCSKISPDGGSLEYSTYIGGKSEDLGGAIGIDPSGSAYVTGRTWSTDFPVKNPVQQTLTGAYDAFVTKISTDGSALVYSTYLGGSSMDEGRGISVNGAGNAYVTGSTSSLNFPVVNPYQRTYGGGELDAFVAKLAADGRTFEYSTYLGGSGRDQGNAVSVDELGNAYIAGITSSTNFPMVNPFPSPAGITGGFAADLKDEQEPIRPPVPDFTSNTTMGLMPLTVMFMDRSTGTPASWYWDFGDGSVSHEKNPVHTYSVPGMFSVSLTAGNSAGSATITKQDYIRVIGSIGGDKGYFLVHSNVDGAAVLFDETPKGVITNGTLNVQVYTTGTPYRSFTLSKEGYITLTQNITHYPGKGETVDLYANLTPVGQPPVAAFNGSPVSGDAPLPVVFTDLSTGNPDTWNWSFGDGSYDNVQEPEHTYRNPGLYSVTLTVSNANGNSSRTRFDYIEVTPGSIGGDTGFFLVHSNVDGAAVLFDQTEQGIITNGTLQVQVYTTAAPFKTFTVSKEGYHSLTQNITQYPGKDETVDLYANLTPVEKPEAAFSANITTGTAPLEVQFLDESTGAPGTWQWNFGDDSPNSTDIDPVHTYSWPGNYTVILTVSSASGSSTLVKDGFITVEPLRETGFFLMHANQTGYQAGPLEGASVYLDQDLKGMTGADGTLLIEVSLTGDRYTSFTVRKYGYYQITGILPVYPGPGDTVDLYANLTSPKEPIIADFEGEPATGIAPLNVSFTDRSIGGPDAWYWNFGDGNVSTEENPVHLYGIPGYYDVTLTARNSQTQLNNTMLKPSYIHATSGPVYPPTAGFTVNATSGPVPLSIQFVDVSSGDPSSWQWNFGDGSENSTEEHPVHVFDVKGLYSVTLTAANSLGSDTIVVPDLIDATGSGPFVPVADFGSNVTTGPIPLVVQFEDRTSGLPLSWNWSFGDGNYSGEQNPVHEYTSAGSYNVSLFAANELGNDTKTQTGYINAFEPQTFFIDASAGADGTITPFGRIPVRAGTDQVFAIVPDANFTVLDVIVDGVSKGPRTTYTFQSVSDNHTISASFIGGGGIVHTITATAGPDGSIIPHGNVQVPDGQNITFSINPDNGFQIDDVLVDTQSAGQPGTYTFSNVTEDHSISATFSNAVYVINATAGDNGTIIPNGTMMFSFGDNQTYTLAPATGFRVQDVVVDGQSVGTPLTYAFTAISRNHTISATFTEDVYYITTSVSGPGTITPGGTVTATPGTDQYFAITPTSGYSILSVFVDDDYKGIASSWTFSNISANHKIYAVFGLAGSGGGGGGGGGSYSAPESPTPTVTPTTTIPVLGTASGTGNEQAVSSITPQVTPTTEVTTGLPATTIPGTSKPFAATPVPTGPTPIWAQIPMKYVLPVVIVIIVIAIAAAGYYLYYRRQKSEQFFER